MASAPTTTAQDTVSEARITQMYPDTYADGDAGEYVGVTFGSPTDTTGWELRDDEASERLPNTTLEGTVYFVAGEPPTTLSNSTVYPLSELELANSGERVELVNATGVVDSVSYGEVSGSTAPAPDEGEVLTLEPTGWVLRSLGSSDFEYHVYPASSVTGFAAPDSSSSVMKEFLKSADETVDMSAYTFDSQAVADALVAAERRGVEVRVLVEGSPPGGFESDDARVLRGLVKKGVEVHVIDGDRERYRFHHAKYAVVDDEKALVTSENWEDETFSPEASGPRGWGVVVESDGVARYLGKVFEDDLGWSSVKDWENVSLDTHEPDSDDEGRHPTRFRSREFDDARVGVVLSPDTSRRAVVRAIRNATRSLYVQQAYIRPWDGSPGSNPYLDAVIQQARSGVEVRVLLDSRWYVEKENRRVVERLNALAESQNLPLEAKLSEGAVHNKGFVVDNRTVFVSSVNWNRNSVKNNREVGVLVHDDEVATYFARVFLHDWRGRSGSGGSPFDPRKYALEILIAVVVASIGAWLALREL
ncbi:MAG: phospholipase D-like domain-containing protein [Halobacteria archaeon]|nr:phospholipase D-like domain-containing protein [Halobacteria archaeon]